MQITYAFIGRSFALACLLGSASTAHSAVLARDLFTYGSNTDLTGPGFLGSNSFSSDIGFSSPWTNVDPGFGTIPNLSGDNISLPFPSGVPGFALGGRINDTNGGFAARTLANPINYAADGVYYISGLFNNNRPSNTGNEYLYLGISQLIDPVTAVPAFSMGIRSDGRGLVGFGSSGGQSVTTGSPLTNGANYMFVARITTFAAAPDQFALSMFQVGVDSLPAAEPMTWDLNYSASLNYPSANLLTLSLGPLTHAQFDEFYFGTDYTSVTFGYVPEPNSFALLVFAGVFIRLIRRRM